jgi:transposase
MSVYSQDLRQRVIDTLERQEGSFRKVATRFRVSLSFVTRLVRRRRDRTTWSGFAAWSARAPMRPSKNCGRPWASNAA